MGKFLVTLFLGWSGVHKFMEKKPFLGILYLFTFGLFGIGWSIDIIKALIALIQYKPKDQTQLEAAPSFQPYNTSVEEDDDKEKDDNRIQFSVAGVTFDNEDGTSRQQILKGFYENRGYSKRDISLQQYEYNGAPAVYVVAKGKIIGNVPKEYTDVIIDNLDTLRIYHFRVRMNSKGIYYSVIDLFLE